MSELALYLPEDIDGVLPITYFHAMARLGLDGLVLVEPRECFVSVGFFDDTEAAVDLDACSARHLPVVRREVGGGPVLLGPGQVFYHLVLPRTYRIVAPWLDEVYRVLSGPVIEAYRRLGVEVSFRPVNDLVTPDGRKITGQGAADIGDRFCFVGAVLRHFDSALAGLPFERAAVADAVAGVLSRHDVQCPGVSPDDFAAAVIGCAATGDQGTA